MTQPNSIRASFKKQTSVARTFLVRKGQLNEFRLRQAVLNEHCETARSVQGVVASGNIVGQVWKQSQDNINGIFLTLESAAGVVFDDFESYLNDAALQAVWEEGTNAATLESTILPDDVSTQAMKLPLDTLADTWTKTITATDFTGYTGSFDLYQDKEFSKAKLSVVLGDGSNTISIQLPVEKEEWTHFDIPISALSEDGGGTTDITAITKVFFRVDDKEGGKFAYIDNYFAVPPPGQVGLKLWDMGTSIPVDGVTALDDGAQYEQLGDLGLNGGVVVSEVALDLVGGEREYFVTKFAGGCALEIPGNELLNVGHYYALTINYIDTDVSVMGSNPDFENDYYAEGYAFTAANESDPISRIGDYNDIQFGIFSTQDVHLNTFFMKYDAVPGNDARDSVRIEDKNMEIEGVITQNSLPSESLIVEFKDRTFFFPKGGKFEVYHNDDFTDDTTQVTILIGYIYKPPVCSC